MSGSPEQPQGWRRLARWWGWAGMFALGLLVGGIIVGLVSDDNVVPPTASDGEASTSAPTSSAPQPTATPGEATGQVVLGEDCLRAINAAEDVVGLVDDLGEALVDFNAARLDEIVRELQPLQGRLRDGVDECNVQASITTGPEASGSSAPEPTSPSTTD